MTIYFCRLLFLTTINFYQQIFLPTFFLQTRTFSISQLKNTLSLSIRLYIRVKLLKRNKIIADQGKKLFPDSQAKKFVDKKWRIIFLLPTILLTTKFYADFFSSDKVSNVRKITKEHKLSRLCFKRIFLTLGRFLPAGYKQKFC